MTDPDMSIYPTERKAPFWVVFATAVLAVIIALATISAAYQSMCEKDFTYVYIAIAVWAIGPPVWFWAEYFGIYLKWGKRESFDLFKYGQQVAASIWAGMLALLLLFANSGAIDPTKEIPSQERCRNMCGVDACIKIETGQ
jgi:membrane protease YdiL (CAAX protease family)